MEPAFVERSNSAQLWKWFTFPPSPLSCIFLSLHPFASLSSSSPDCESISGSLKTCQMCSDQCNGLRVHYIHCALLWGHILERSACHSALPHSKPSLAEVRRRKRRRRRKRKSSRWMDEGGWKSGLPLYYAWLASKKIHSSSGNPHLH